jgi:ATP-binding cassette, subfamily B, bacterial PglK
MLITAFLEMLSLSLIPLFISAIVDLKGLISYLPSLEFFFLNYDQKEIIVFGSFLLVVIFLLKNSMLVFQYYNENSLIMNLNKSFSVKLFRNYLNSSYLFYISKNTGFFIRNLTSEVNNSVSLAYSFLVLSREGLVTFVIIVILFLRSPSITILLFLILISSTFFFFKKYKTKIKKTSLFNQELRSSQMQLINQSFGLFKTVKMFNIEKILSNKFDDLTLKKEKGDFYLRFIKQIPRLLFELIAVTSLLLICLFLLIFYSGENILIILSTIAIAVIRLVPAFNSITSALAGINQLTVSFKTIYPELINNKDDKDEYLNYNQPSNKRSIEPFKSISLENVNFKYDGQKDFFIKNLNIKINKGENIAIVGKSGSGKTTFVDIIVGLLNISSGNYILNGENFLNPVRYWRSKVGYVAQDVYLIDDTIKSNVSFSEFDFSEDIDKKILESLKKSAINQFIQQLPKKELTKVGERGMALSGGQRQRLAFARAIYNNPEVIIMDEATSALDEETEQEVLRSLETIKQDKTLFIITHKPKTILSMDKVIFMENGEIKFFGNKEEYFKRYNIQK